MRSKYCLLECRFDVPSEVGKAYIGSLEDHLADLTCLPIGALERSLDLLKGAPRCSREASHNNLERFE